MIYTIIFPNHPKHMWRLSTVPHLEPFQMHSNMECEAINLVIQIGRLNKKLSSRTNRPACYSTNAGTPEYSRYARTNEIANRFWAALAFIIFSFIRLKWIPCLAFGWRMEISASAPLLVVWYELHRFVCIQIKWLWYAWRNHFFPISLPPLRCVHVHMTCFPTQKLHCSV